MSRLPRAPIAAAAAGLLALTIGAAAFAADEPATLVKYRKSLMDANSAHLGMIAAAVKGDVSFTDGLADNASARTCASAALPVKIPLAATETERTPAPDNSSRQPPLPLLVMATASPFTDNCVVFRPATVA